MAVWDDVLGATDRKVFEAAGWGRPAGLGQRPVLLVIDVNYNFVGDRPEPILDSIKRWRYSCGERGWQGVAAIGRLLERARALRLPVAYTTNPRRPDGFDLGVWNDKSWRSGDDTDVQGHLGRATCSWRRRSRRRSSGPPWSATWSPCGPTPCCCAGPPP
ncbi:MAG TPA: hypothetical protein VG499_18860, partial [Actinomycetota bacterium]|nr:hypothetical protein [Actinomycetota bacterium]